jgi:ABC-type polysaccharide/polyol phosphate export permease
MEMIPQEYRIIFVCNPVTLYIGLYRDALLGGGHGVWSSFLMATVLAISSLVVGYKIFFGCEKDFLKRI